MIKSYWLRILFCGIATAIIGFLIAAATPKQFDAVLQLMVAPTSSNQGSGNDEASASVEDILNASAPRTVTTQVETLTSVGVIQTAAKRVAEDMQLHYETPGDELNPFDLQDKISISAAKESDMV